MIKEEIKNIKSSRRNIRNFGLTVGIALIVLDGLMFWRGRGTWTWLSGLGAILALLGVFAPLVLKPLQKTWMAFAVVLSFLMTNLILVILFYVVLTPLSLIARVFGKLFLELGFDKNKKTYWHYREGGDWSKEALERQF